MRAKSIAWMAGALMLSFPAGSVEIQETSREKAIRFLVNTCFDQVTKKDIPRTLRITLEGQRQMETRIQLTNDIMPETRKSFRQIAQDLKKRYGCGFKPGTPA